MAKFKKHIVVLTGAGISAESGIKTFRDSDGLWEGYNVEDVATPMAFNRNPQLVLNFYNERRRNVLNALPNEAHKGIAALEKNYKVTVITQNVDDLHERGGSKNIIHLHGEILKMRSVNNPNIIFDCTQDINVGDKANDGGQLRPHIVWFHEDVPMMQTATNIVDTADIFVIIGTSLQVYPAASLINYAPPYCPKFLIDKHIPKTSGITNLTCIEEPATIGVKKLIELLVK